MFYFTTSVQMKHFQYVIHKPECSIQTQVVILKVLMIKSSAVSDPPFGYRNLFIINTLIYYFLLYSFIVSFTTSSQLYFAQIKSAA